MKKLRRKNGFTLIEMLIVVAIIAILIAVSIPLVSSSLERARKATDAANERAAKAEILICYMTDSEYAPGQKVIAATVDNIGNVGLPGIYAYDAASGNLTKTVPVPYGKCNEHEGKFLLVWIKESGDVFMFWTGTEKFPSAGIPEYGGNLNLCGPTLND